jgi:hypothetical protein
MYGMISRFHFIYIYICIYIYILERERERETYADEVDGTDDAELREIHHSSCVWPPLMHVYTYEREYLNDSETSGHSRMFLI